MTDLIGTEDSNFFTIEPDTNSVDGLGGQDFVSIDLDRPEFGIPNGPETVTLTTDRIFDSGGRIDLAMTSIEVVFFTIDNPDLVTLDASGLNPVAGTLVAAIIDLLDSNSNVTGSALRDIITVSGTGNFVDAGDGIDQVTVNPTASDHYLIQGDGEAAVIFQVNGDQSQTELVRALNVERVGVEASRDFGVLTVDASGSNVRARFRDGSTNETFIGSAFNDFFTISSLGGNSTDMLTSNGGADFFQFGLDNGLERFDFITITDFRPDDGIDLNPLGVVNTFEVTSFIGRSEFSGVAGEYRFFTGSGQTFVQFDGNGDGVSDGTLTIANGEFELEQAPLAEGNDHFLRIAGYTFGTDEDEDFTGTDGADRFFASTGDDTIDGGSNVDTAGVSGNRADYTVAQTSSGVFEVSGADGTDTLTNVEFLEFDDQTVRLLPGTGVSVAFDAANPATYQSAMNAIRDFDGNVLGGNGDWLLIGSFDINGDGDLDQVLVNDTIGRFATVGTADDGLVYFDDHSWAGETRVAGIYIDPLVESGDVEQGGPFDSQRRFQNDLLIDNINEVLGANDYDGDGVWEVYFALTDGTAYLRALMHADGNIRYANYQSEAEVRDYLTANGFGEETFGTWFDNGTTGTIGGADVAIAAPGAGPNSAVLWAPQGSGTFDIGMLAEAYG